MRRLIYIVLTALCLTGCAKQTNDVGMTKNTSTEVSLETLESLETTEANESESEETHNYREYIPIWENGKQSNLYDMLESKEIIYIRRYDCPDCAEYEESILRQIEETGIPYMILECSKTAQDWEDGPAIPSKVVKSIGIGEIPAVLFVMNGSFITRIENQFTQDGDEIQMTADSAFR